MVDAETKGDVMKRFLLFCGDHYYPVGGMSDFAGDFDTLDAAKAAAHSDWCNVLDTKTRQVFYRLGGYWSEDNSA